MDAVVDFVRGPGLALTEASFAAGMLSGLNSKVAGEKTEEVLMGVINTIYHGKYRDSHVRNIKKLSPLVQLQVSKSLFAVAFVWTILTLDQRPFLWNLLKLGYSYTSIAKTLPDILTDDDRKAWSHEKKVIHFLFPWEIESSKKLSSDLQPTGVDNRVNFLFAEGMEMGGGLPEGGIAFLACAVLYMFGPGWASNLAIAVSYPHILNALNVLYHIGMTYFFKNSFKGVSLFGDNIKLGMKGTKNQPYGLHYEYFANQNLLFQSWLHKQVYSPWKDQQKSTRLPKMMMILARGLFVVLAMLCASYQGGDIGLVMLYYMAHAFGGYYVHGNELKDFRQLLVFGAEPLLSAFLWVGPILSRPITQSIGANGPSVFNAGEAITDLF